MISEVNHARFDILFGVKEFDLTGDAKVPAAGALELLVKVLLHFTGVAVDID